MVQIPIINGIYTNNNADFRTSYPKNFYPIPKQNGISEGYLRPAEGVDLFTNGVGADRGGINWNGIMYRVSGSKLIRIASNGAINIIGDVGNDNKICTFDYSFDYLAVASDNKLWLWNNIELKQVTDEDLGNVIDFVWIDGYFMTTDGSYLVVTELNDPFSVNTLKYGSSEVSPDPIVALLKLRNEVYAVNRYTIEIFDNVGGENFPFQRVSGAFIQRGCIGTKACAVFMDSIAFVGSGTNEAIGIYMGANGSSVKISTREIDQILAEYTDNQLQTILVETRSFDTHQFLYIHLPDRTFVYDGAATQATNMPIWFELSTGDKYAPRNYVWCYNNWYCGDIDNRKIGKLTYQHSKYYGTAINWEFATNIIYNETKGAIVHSIELTTNSGVSDSLFTISTQKSDNGSVWSPLKTITTKVPKWYSQGYMRKWRVQKFLGDSNCHLSFARLDAEIEPLNA